LPDSDFYSFEGTVLMSGKVIKIGDQKDLVKTAAYPYAKWEWEEFNPVQSRLMDTFAGDSNIAIAAATSSGKTVCAEMYMAYEARVRKGKSIYIGPMKALAAQKEQDWTDSGHHFSDLKTSITTGDFRFTGRRITEIEKSDIIVMTPEMLASRCRNWQSDKSKFLQDVGTVSFDESHLLGVPSRGDHIEVALMKLTEMNPHIRVVLLSATLPNVDEICGWISNLTGRDTYCLESKYRPCPLFIHYETYWDGDNSYDAKEAEKVASACGIVEYYADDKFLVFVHTKRTGRLVVKALESCGIPAEFHNADVSLEARRKLERRFKEEKDFRVIVATSTLAWGMNLPARRVIIVGIHRGLSDVENYDIWQEVGRSGRVGLDPQGDAYILVPESTQKETIAKLKKKPPIKSTLLEFVGKAENPYYKTLAFHVVAEIHQGNIRTKEGFHDWAKRSLAHFQDLSFDDQVIDSTLELLTQCRAIKLENGEYTCTGIGKVASMFYFSPFDVSDLKKNFDMIFTKGLKNDELALSMAMGNIDSHRWAIVNREEKAAMALFQKKVEKKLPSGFYTAGCLKAGFCYYNMIQGIKSDAMTAYQGMIQSDLDRTMQVVQALDTMSGQWGEHESIRITGLRFRYGVGADLVQLCQIPNVGQARAKKLKAAKINNIDDFIKYSVDELRGIMKCGQKLAEEALAGARRVKAEEMGAV
jgi:helicase